MQRGGHGCSVEGTWVGRTREAAGPDFDLVRTETKKVKSLRDLIFVCWYVFQMRIEKPDLDQRTINFMNVRRDGVI